MTGHATDVWNRPRPRGPRVTGRHVLSAMIGFFAVLFLVDGSLIYFAVSTFGGVETPDAYRKGLAYNDRIAAGEAQARLGWLDSLEFSRERESLAFRLADGDGRPVAGLAVAARLSRPATDRFDREVALAETAAGSYEAAGLKLEPGAWTLDVTAARTGASPIYETRKRLWVAP